MRALLIFSLLMCAPGPSLAQSTADLLAQLSELRGQIRNAEQAGVDGELIAQLRTMADELEETIRTDAEEEAAPASVDDGGVEGAAPVAPAFQAKPNQLVGQAACAEFTESNYRELGLGGGDDVQLKTMCAQAFELYVAYKRAIAQGYSEADADRTNAAHSQAALNAVSFYENNRAD